MVSGIYANPILISFFISVTRITHPISILVLLIRIFYIRTVIADITISITVSTRLRAERTQVWKKDEGEIRNFSPAICSSRAPRSARPICDVVAGSDQDVRPRTACSAASTACSTTRCFHSGVSV